MRHLAAKKIKKIQIFQLQSCRKERFWSLILNSDLDQQRQFTAVSCEQDVIFLNPFRGPAADHLDPAADWPPLCLGRLELFRNGLIIVEVFFWKCFLGFQSVFNFTLVVPLFYNLNRWLLSLWWLRSHGCLNLPWLPIKTRRQRSSLLPLHSEKFFKLILCSTGF